jgi:hypothetical protein
MPQARLRDIEICVQRFISLTKINFRNVNYNKLIYNTYNHTIHITI